MSDTERTHFKKTPKGYIELNHLHDLELSAYEAGKKHANTDIIKLLKKHVWQIETAPNGDWKQKCRCGFYGVFNEHLTILIEGQKDNETVVLLTKNDAEQLANAIEEAE